MIRTPISPAGSTSSTFSFWSGRSTSTAATSTSSTSTTATNNASTTSANHHTRPESPRITSCKLIWGLCSKNFKPGLLFATNAHPGAPTTATLLFLPLGKSFKTPCVDSPSLILTTLIETFELAQATIPSTSAFATSLTPQNHAKLLSLKQEAEEWERCGQVEGRFLAKGPVIQEVEDTQVVERLLRQPNIFRILREAGKVFSCTELGITSPTQALMDAETGGSLDQKYTAPSPFAVNAELHKKGIRPALSDTIGTSTDTSTGSNWLHIEKHVYRPVLQHYFSTLLPCDPILSLPLQTFSQLSEKFSEVQLSLNMWFAPYNRDEKVFPTVTECVGYAVSVLGAENSKKKEREGRLTKSEIAAVKSLVIKLAEEETWRWVREANELRRVEHEFNVWNLGLQRCARLKVTV